MHSLILTMLTGYEMASRGRQRAAPRHGQTNQPLMKASRFSFTLSLWVSVSPWGAPG
jgi:hypothetical protein